MQEVLQVSSGIESTNGVEDVFCRVQSIELADVGVPNLVAHPEYAAFHSQVNVLGQEALLQQNDTVAFEPANLVAHFMQLLKS